MSTKDKWVWMPHAGHFIASQDCRFVLNTYVGKYVVSTVGEYWPDRHVRAIFAASRGIKIVGPFGDAWDQDYMRKIGYHEIGLDRKYETMVFKAVKTSDKCCPWRIDVSKQVDFEPYNDAESATVGHKKLCLKWSKK